MSTNIRTGIIGHGLSGRVFHAPFIDVVEGYDLSKISTSRAESIALIEERYPVTAIVPDGKNIIVRSGDRSGDRYLAQHRSLPLGTRSAAGR